MALSETVSVPSSDIDTPSTLFTISHFVSRAGIIVDKTGDSKNDYIAVVKVFDENKKLIIEHDIAIGELTDGVQKIDTDLMTSFEKFFKFFRV